MLEPQNADKGDANILEFKVFNPATEKSLQDTAASALRQIEQKNYSALLVQKSIPENRIRKYGVAFQGKQVLIG